MHLRIKDVIMAIYLSLLLVPLGLSCFTDTTEAAPSSSKRSGRLSPALIKTFQKAVDAFDDKKFDSALDLFNQVLQKQSDYAPAKIYAARCLYKLAKMPEAHKLFQQVDTEFFDPIDNYEAGQTAYNVNSFALTVSYMKRVPEGHPLFDMAGYYGGIAAFKLGDYDAAILLFEQAVVLPSKLVKTQQTYLREAERQQVNQKNQEKDKGKGRETQKPEALVSVNLPIPVIDEQSRTYRFLRPLRSVAILPRRKLQKQTNALDIENSYEITTEEIQLNMGFSHEHSAQSAHYVLQAQGSFYGLQGSSREIPLFVDTRREQELYIISQAAPKTVLFVEADFGVEWPVQETHTLGLSLGLYSHMPNHYDVSNLFTPWLGVFYSQRSSTIEVQLNAEVHSRFEDEELLKITAKQNVILGINLPYDLRINLQGDTYEYSYKNDTSDTPTDGPEWTARGTAEIGLQKSMFRIFFGGIYEVSDHLRMHYIPDTPPVEFQTKVDALTARTEFEFFKRLRIGAAYQDVRRVPADLRQDETAIKLAYVPFITEFTAYLNLYDTF